ncbi:hypothetical protein Tsubulata_044004 [Turnera subulata]|uniref:X8 domain-containing protein n=1 Tax=Turnera subulata TaxID=218843 RepID=A0A9Q0F1Q6_9ROSI|nr:hypothetical protein Tsubulata_044004 [Turnera subulata]
MGRSKEFNRVCVLLLCFAIVATSSFTLCAHARRLKGPIGSFTKHTKKLKVTEHFNLASLLLQKETMDSSNTSPYVSSPFTLPPYDSLPPITLPDNSPPYCNYPPNTPQSPSTLIPTPPATGYTPLSPPPFYYLPPVLPLLSPPPSPTNDVPNPPEYGPTPYPPETGPSPPGIIPNPPESTPNPPIIIPGPPVTVPNPPIVVPSPSGPSLGPPYYEPSPPSYTPNPPISVPSPPTGFVPSPRGFLPPVIYPAPPPPKRSSAEALWCMAKPSVPDPIIQEAMNYACGSGADCSMIQPSGPCFQPNTLFAHASYAFNSYWQRTKGAGGTCSFGGIAMLVTVDPSYDGCHFIYN